MSFFSIISLRFYTRTNKLVFYFSLNMRVGMHYSFNYSSSFISYLLSEIFAETRILPGLLIVLLRSEICLMSVWGGIVDLTSLPLSLRLMLPPWVFLMRLRFELDLVWLISLTLLLLSNSFCILSSSLSYSFNFYRLVPPISAFWMGTVFLIGWIKFLVLTIFWAAFLSPPVLSEGLLLKVTGSISSAFNSY